MTLTPQEKYEAFAASRNAGTQTAEAPAPAAREIPEAPETRDWDERIQEAMDDFNVTEQQFDELIAERERERVAVRKASKPSPTEPPPARESAKDAIKTVATEIKTLEAQLADPNTSQIEQPTLRLKLDRLRQDARIYDQRLPHSGLTDEEVSDNMLSTGVFVESARDQLKALGNEPGKRFTRMDLEAKITAAEARLESYSAENGWRKEEARFEKTIREISESEAVKDRGKQVIEARNALLTLEADIKKNGYAGHGPQLEHYEGEIKRLTGLIGKPPSAEEVAAQRLKWLGKSGRPTGSWQR